MDARTGIFHIAFCCGILLVPCSSLSNGDRELGHQIDFTDPSCGDAFQTLLSHLESTVQPLQQEIANLQIEMADMRNKHAVEMEQLRDELAQLSNSRGDSSEKGKYFVGEEPLDGDKPVSGESNIQPTNVAGSHLPLDKDPQEPARNEVDPNHVEGMNKQRVNISFGRPVRGQRYAPQPIRRQTDGYHVAFFAKLSKHVTQLGVNQHVVFDNVVTNVGNGYDKNIGVFRVPVAGTYLISATITTFQHDNGHFGIFINQNQESRFVVNGAENAYDETSQTLIVHLNVGDDVTVRSVLDVNHGVFGAHYSLFSGALLFEDNEQSAIVGK